MRGDNAQPLDGWVCEPRAWDADNCCRACEPDTAEVLRIAAEQAERWKGTLALLAAAEADEAHILRGEN